MSSSYKTTIQISTPAVLKQRELNDLETLVVLVPEVVLKATVEERERDVGGSGHAEACRERGVGSGVDGDGDEEELRRDVHEGLLALRPFHGERRKGADDLVVRGTEYPVDAGGRRAGRGV